MSSTQFVEMYHPLIPSTEITPARVPVQAIDENAARGWLLVDPDAVLPTPDTPYYTTAAADSRFVQQTVLLDGAGTVKDAKLPTRLSDVELRATFDARAIRDLLVELTSAANTVPTGSSVTVTVGAAGANSAIAGAINLTSPSWPLVYFAGGPYVATTTNSVEYRKNAAMLPDTSFPAAVEEFTFDGDKLGVKVCNVIPGTTAYWVFVDGVAQSASPIPVTDGTGTAGSRYEVLLTFASAARRRIRFVIAAGYYGGMNGLATYALSPAGQSRRRVAVVGDSWVGGALNVPEFELWANRLALVTGWDVARFGQGGTGYVNPGTSPKVAYGNAARTAQLVAWDPDLVIVYGSQNDDAYSASTVQAAATALFSSFATGLPRPTPVVVVGPPRTAAAPTAGRLANRDALRAAAATAPNVIGFIDQIGGTATTPAWSASTTYAIGDLVTNNSGVVYQCMVAHTSTASFNTGVWMPVTWLVGTGRVGATTGTGPTDRLVGTDGAHLTSEGHDYFQRRMMTALAETVRGYLAA